MKPHSGVKAVLATWLPTSPGTLGSNAIAFLESAGHLCFQDGALGQAQISVRQHLGIN